MSKTYIHLQFPDFAKLPPTIGPRESAIMYTALMRLRYELLCRSCVSSERENLDGGVYPKTVGFLRETAIVHNERRPAPPAPLIRRPTTNWRRLWAVPAMILPKMNIHTSTINMRFVPKTSCKERGYIDVTNAHLKQFVRTDNLPVSGCNTVVVSR